MFSPDLVQALLIATLKANTALTQALVNAEEVREAGWKGTQFKYPNVRLRMGIQLPHEDGTCAGVIAIQQFTVEVFSEKESSIEASEIAGLVDTALRGKHIKGTGFQTGEVRPKGILSGIRHTPNLWRSDVHFITRVYPA